MFLVAGLGNPGPKYEATRHNVGFLTVDRLARDFNVPVAKLMFKALVGQITFGGTKIVLAKPQTYMNLSGNAVAGLLGWFKQLPSELVVIYDDMDLPVGSIRIKAKGGHGGHRGMMSIVEQLGTNEFIRVRIGIGRPDIPEMETADWVLGRFSAEEEPVVKKVVEAAAQAVKSIITDGVEIAMNKYNRVYRQD